MNYILRKLYKRFGIGIAFAAIGLICLVGGIVNIDKSAAVTPSYIQSVGTVTEVREVPGISWVAYIDYTDQNGIDRQGIIEYDHEVTAGEKVVISINSYNPQIIAGETVNDVPAQSSKKTYAKTALIEIGSGIVLLAACCMLIVRRHRKNTAEEEAAQAAQAEYQRKHDDYMAAKQAAKQAEERKQQSAPVNEPQTDCKKQAAEIKRLIENDNPKKPYVKLIPVPANNLDVYESKAGGTPYWPKTRPYPVAKGGENEGKPLRFLAQLNFEKLPHLEDFPEKGILQFFCLDDTLYGMNMENQRDQSCFRVVYHENITNNPVFLYKAHELPQFPGPEDNEREFPLYREFHLRAEDVSYMPVTYSDYHFRQGEDKYVGQICGGEPDEDVLMEICELCEIPDISCIGGYPNFVQEDPRINNEKLSDADVLLFQLCSMYHGGKMSEDISWGDSGMGYFLINRDQLLRRDFSKAVYEWQCC